MATRLARFLTAAAALFLLVAIIFMGQVSVTTAPPEPDVGSISQASAPAEQPSRAGGNVAFAQEIEPSSDDGTVEPTAEESSNGGGPGIIEERTPVPTATEGALEAGVAQIAEATGLNRVEFLGLTGEEWINLAVSILIVLGAYLLASWLLWVPLRRLVRRSPSEFDNQALAAVGPHLRWLIVILGFSFATQRLGFVSAGVKQVLGDIYFVAGAILADRDRLPAHQPRFRAVQRARGPRGRPGAIESHPDRWSDALPSSLWSPRGPSSSCPILASTSRL